MINILQDKFANQNTPYIDQDQVTFSWRGRTAPRLEGDFTGWEDGKPVKLEKNGKGLWIYQQRFPLDAYIEYSFVKGEEGLLDPSNPRKTPNGVGGFNNYFSMPDYLPTNLVKKNAIVKHGILRQFAIVSDYLVSGHQRNIYLYQPPVTDPVPLLVVWDGLEYLKRVRLNIMVDNLIAQGRMQPIALAMVSNGGERSRNLEYSCNDATLGLLMTKIVPLARKELNLIDIRSHPGEFGILGASMGGLMALYTGARLPRIFGKVLSQSGAFSFGTFDMVVFDLLEHGLVRPLKVWLDIGHYDLPGILESNRRMRDILAGRGYSIFHREYNAGHNYPAWRDELWRGLEALFSMTG